MSSWWKERSVSVCRVFLFHFTWMQHRMKTSSHCIRAASDFKGGVRPLTCELMIFAVCLSPRSALSSRSWRLRCSPSGRPRETGGRREQERWRRMRRPLQVRSADTLCCTLIPSDVNSLTKLNCVSVQQPIRRQEKDASLCLIKSWPTPAARFSNTTEPGETVILPVHLPTYLSVCAAVSPVCLYTCLITDHPSQTGSVSVWTGSVLAAQSKCCRLSGRPTWSRVQMSDALFCPSGSRRSESLMAACSFLLLVVFVFTV